MQVTAGFVVAEYAPSGSYSCRHCGQVIARNIVRIGYIMNKLLKKKNDTKWFHIGCLQSPPSELAYLIPGNIMGFELLTKPDRDKLKEKFKSLKIYKQQIVEDREDVEVEKEKITLSDSSEIEQNLPIQQKSNQNYDEIFEEMMKSIKEKLCQSTSPILNQQEKESEAQEIQINQIKIQHPKPQPERKRKHYTISDVNLDEL